MKFGYLENCGLAAAEREGRTYSSEDHKKQCNHGCCPHCGKWQAGRLRRDHGHKGKAIGDSTREVLLTWHTMPVHSDSVFGVVRFVLAVGRLKPWFDNVAVARRWVDGFVGGSEYNAPGMNADGKVQCHVHIACLVRDGQWLRLLRALKKVWIEFGGGRLRPAPRRGTVGGIMGYLSKEPIQEFSEEGREKLHERVFRRAEDILGATPIVRFVGGPALSGPGYQKLRERARHEGKSLREKMRDMSFKAAGYLPSVRDVYLVEVCPKCKGPVKKNGRTPAGTRRWRCKRCAHSWVRFPSPYRARLVPGSRMSISEARSIVRLHRHYGSIASTVRNAGLTRYSVRLALNHFHVTVEQTDRSPKPKAKNRTRSR